MSATVAVDRLPSDVLLLVCDALGSACTAFVWVCRRMNRLFLGWYTTDARFFSTGLNVSLRLVTHLSVDRLSQLQSVVRLLAMTASCVESLSITSVTAPVDSELLMDLSCATRYRMPRLTSLSLDLWVPDCDTGKDAFSSIVAGNLQLVNRLRLGCGGRSLKAVTSALRAASATVCRGTTLTIALRHLCVDASFSPVAVVAAASALIDAMARLLSVIRNRLSTLILGLDGQFVTDRDIKRLADAPTRTIGHLEMSLDGNCILTVGLVHISRIVASTRRRYCVFSLHGNAVSTYGRDALRSVGMWDTGDDRWVLLDQSPKVGTVTNVKGFLCA